MISSRSCHDDWHEFLCTANRAPRVKRFHGWLAEQVAARRKNQKYTRPNNVHRVLSPVTPRRSSLDTSANERTELNRLCRIVRLFSCSSAFACSSPPPHLPRGQLTCPRQRSPVPPFPDMNEDETTADASLVSSALEHPMARYVEWAERRDVANALAMFKSEYEIRKTGRLDLVTWVQYICGFGYVGPSDNAWAALFAACRVLPTLESDQTILSEQEIAVLLAYAKIKPDYGDSMTASQLVKHRIKPAVLGRTVARTPGILKHLRGSFEKWALGPFTDSFCDMCVSTFGPSQFMPGADDLPSSLPDVGESIRHCAHAHANTLLKTWGGIVTAILDIEGDDTSERAHKFELKLCEKRNVMYQQLFIKISEHFFNRSQQNGYVPGKMENLQYRENPYSPVMESEKLLYAKERTSSRLAEFIRRAITTVPPHRTLPAWSMVTTHVTICELHQPSRYGQAGLDFVHADRIQTNVVKLKAQEANSAFALSKTVVRIGTFNSRPLMKEVHGVPPSQMCRALRMELLVAVLPPKVGSTRPKFQIVNINRVDWVELTREEDECEELDPLSELGMDYDEHGDRDAQDSIHQWYVSVGIGKYLAMGSGAHWEVFDQCEGMTKHKMEITVPDELLRRVRVHGKVAEQTLGRERKTSFDADYCSRASSTEGRTSSCSYSTCNSIDIDVDLKSGGSETFSEVCWVDCQTGAQITYEAPAGVELCAATPSKKGMFSNIPYWKSRTP